MGAGAHLVINDTLGQLVGSRFSFMEWLLLGLPFAAISAFGSTWMILRIFLTRQERSLRMTDHLQQQLAAPGAWTRQERYVGLVTLVLAALWMTETWHGIDNALVALMGALAVSLPPFGPLKFKDAAKAVEWEMILFVAASLALSEALVMSGAGRWLVDLLLGQSGLRSLGSELAILAGVAANPPTAPLYITPRSAGGGGSPVAPPTPTRLRRPSFPCPCQPSRRSQPRPGPCPCCPSQPWRRRPGWSTPCSTWTCGSS